MRALVALGLLGGLCGIGLGFMGAFHPAFDSLAHFRVFAVFGTTILGILAILIGGRFLKGLAAAAFGAAVVGAVSVAPTIVPRVGATTGEGEPATLLSMNLRYDASPAEAAALIEERAPDLIILQEVNDPAIPMLSALRGRYPHQAVCRSTKGVGSTAILSPVAFVGAPDCHSGIGYLGVRVSWSGGLLGLGSVHISWPWPFNQPAAIEGLERIFADIDGPLILAGDFNAAAWSNAVRRVARGAGARVVTGIGGTFPSVPVPGPILRVFALPIDNVLVTEEIEILSATALPPTASDHLPVFFEFAVERQGSRR